MKTIGKKIQEKLKTFGFDLQEQRFEIFAHIGSHVNEKEKYAQKNQKMHLKKKKETPGRMARVLTNN